jgi:hypothetical protein
LGARQNITICHSMQNKYHNLLNLTLCFKIFFLAFCFLIPAFAQAQATENCTNGIDDDGDGLIDCYDTDCTCTGQCDDFYYTTCNADCYYVPPCNNISLGTQWTSQAQTNTYSPLVAGDMDADGIPDIVTYECEMTNIYIIDGATGATKVTIVSPTPLPGGTSPAIADLDNDGFGEIVIVGEDRLLRCYEHTGALKYTSAVQVGYGVRYRYCVPNIADFDHDGFAEVNIGNQVFNGQTGAMLASGGSTLSAGEHPKRVANNFSFNMPVAIDALPDSFCPDCDGLEIVAGNQVLSVNLVTGAVTAVVTAPAAYSDGFTSVVDWDNDGDLDAIVQGQKNNWNYVYCWEIETSTIIGEYRLINNYIEGASRVNVADLNGDGSLEMSFCCHPRLYALRNNFTPLWIKANNDASSVTCSSVFDFCGDGSADIVYRGQDFLLVLEGATGQTKFSDECSSATHIENPLILDVDADGQTEIIIQCGAGFSGGNVLCYEAIGTPGIASRPVWNQHAYFSTNINDDLSVPRYQQNPHIVGDSLKMNGFLNQFFNPTFPSPDGVISFQSVDCQQDSMSITVQICNTGDNVLPQQMPISVYRGNPLTTPAIWVGAAPIGTTIGLGGCQSLSFKLPRALMVNDTIYLALNDDHSEPTPYALSQFPITALGECGFTNNFAKFYYAYNPATLNLGNDTLICDNATMPLSASGNDIVSFQWQNGAITPGFTAPDAGSFWVQTTDICGNLQRDTITIGIDSATVAQIGADLVICEGETVTVSESGFDTYLWKGVGATYDCTTCPAADAFRANTGPIILEARLDNGCFSTDTLLLTVNDTFYVQIDTFLCKGDVFTMLNVNVLPGSTQFYNLSTIHGCDSTIYVNVIAKDTFATDEVVVICPGTSYAIFGQSQSNAGFYAKTFMAQNGCDSTHTVELKVQPLISLSVTADSSCLNEPTGRVVATVTGGLPPFVYQWVPALPATATVEDLPLGNYALTVTDANDCTVTDAVEIEGYPAIVYAVTADSVQCFGESNGQINIATTDPSLLFALDDGAFADVDAFEGLSAQPYTIYAADAYGCSDTTEINVGQPGQLLVNLPQDTTILFGDSVQVKIQTTAQNILRYTWSTTAFLSDTATLETFSRPHNTVRYTLTLTDVRGCSATDAMTIMIERVKQVYVPNVFALNPADDTNARLAPGFGNSVGLVRQFQVYDRWGSLVHHVQNALPNDSGVAWDGQWRDRKANLGVYIWQMEVELIDGTVERYMGDVTLLR